MNIKIMTYSQETINYVTSIKNYLVSRYGSVKPEWELMLSMLADNVEQYARVMESIEENGIWNFEREVKNPLLSTAKDLQATIFKQVQHLGISPYADAKIKTVAEDDTDDFLNNLTTEDLF